MTTSTVADRSARVPGRSLAWLRRWQQQLSDRIHADGDVYARQNGWTVTPVTGRFGFSGRIYRDPRFDQRATVDPARRAALRAHQSQKGGAP
jgi:hypothetical protein